MKQVLVFFLFVLSILSCSEKNNLTITGQVAGLKKGTLFLQRADGLVLKSIDSVIISTGEGFIFETQIEEPEMLYLRLHIKDGVLLDDMLPFFAEPGEIKVQTSLKNFNVDAIIKGSTNQQIWEEYKKVTLRYTDRKLHLVQQLLEAGRQKNDSLQKTLQIQQQRATNAVYLAAVNYAYNHAHTPVAPYIMVTDVRDANIKFLDTVYNVLAPAIKNSKYGNALQQLIAERKR